MSWIHAETDKHRLELGAGGGLVGLAVALARREAAAGAAGGGDTTEDGSPPIYITDQEPMLSLMEHNIVLNGLQRRVKAGVLNW